MNVRLTKNSVRFRISKDEFEVLQGTGELSTATRFPGGQELRYGIKVEGSSFQMVFDGKQLLFTVSPAHINELAKADLAKGIEFKSENLSVSLEIDIFTARKSH